MTEMNRSRIIQVPATRFGKPAHVGWKGRITASDIEAHGGYENARKAKEVA